MENVIFNDDAKNALIDGVNVISDAVATTYGPNGKNVVIKKANSVHITKDGATVAKFVSSNDPFKMMGIDLMKKIAIKTASDVGDGTTTSIILAREIINKFKDFENPIQLSRELEKECKLVVDYLETQKKEINSLEDLVKVATISTNNDEKLGQLVAETFYNVTKDGIVNVEASQDVETTVTYSKGFKLPNGFMSPYFINTIKNNCELENVLVGIFRTPIKESKEILSLCDTAIRSGKSLLIFAPKIDSAVLRNLIVNKDKGILKSCCVTSPGHGKFREEYLSDIETILGESMTCEKVIVSKDNTFILGGNNETTEAKEVISELKKSLQTKKYNEFEESHLRKRLANYIGGVATIYVGGYSEVEITEKIDRLDDAIAATKAAMDGGILPGGGQSLFRTSTKIKLTHLTDILRTPLRLLTNSSQFKNGHWLDYSDFWQGVNLKTGETGDMYEMGIVDPFLVTKISLENAISVASLILTNGCAILTMTE